jgi:hypothetical protein
MAYCAVESRPVQLSCTNASKTVHHGPGIVSGAIVLLSHLPSVILRDVPQAG